CNRVDAHVGHLLSPSRAWRSVLTTLPTSSRERRRCGTAKGSTPPRPPFAARGTRRRQAAPPHTDATPGTRRGRRHGAAGLRRTVRRRGVAAHRPFGRESGRGVLRYTASRVRAVGY